MKGKAEAIGGLQRGQSFTVPQLVKVHSIIKTVHESAAWKESRRLGAVEVSIWRLTLRRPRQLSGRHGSNF
jgi:hypothetical protein